MQDIGELTALQWAAVRGHDGLIKLAILNGAEIDKPLQGKLVATALSRFDIPNWKFICKLANGGADTEADDSIIRTPLYLAACSGHLDAIQALLKLGASTECFGVGEMDTPAHISAQRGDVDCMRAFGARFDINARGREDRTILHRAIFGGVEMVTYLLQLEGMEKIVNARDRCRQTPLHLAMEVYDRSDNSSELAEVLLQHGADIHARDELGNTPAHIAACLGDVNSMRVFTAAGIDFCAKGISGETILHRATIFSKKGMVEYLLGQEGGRSIVNVTDDHKNTPLHYALEMDLRVAVERLVACGANIDLGKEKSWAYAAARCSLVGSSERLLRC